MDVLHSVLKFQNPTRNTGTF